MGTATAEASQGVAEVQARVRSCQSFAAAKQLIITADGRAVLRPELFVQCLINPVREAEAKAAQHQLTTSISDTIALAKEVDANYRSKLVQVVQENDSQDATDPRAAHGEATPTLPYLDDAVGFSYDKLVEWTSSDTAQTILRIARQYPALFNRLLDYAVSARDGNAAAWIPLFLEAALGYEGGAAATAAFTLYKQMQSKGEWDLKPYLASRYEQQLLEAGVKEPEETYFYLSDEEGNKVRSDMLGNINYGAIMAHLGVDLETALKAANISGPDVGQGGDHLDDAAVRLGYELYQKYPGGMTQEQYIEEIEKAKLYD